MTKNEKALTNLVSELVDGLWWTCCWFPSTPAFEILFSNREEIMKFTGIDLDKLVNDRAATLKGIRERHEKMVGVENSVSSPDPDAPF